MHYVSYILITNDMATYREIRDEYDIDEVLDLYEASLVSNYNKQLAIEGGRK